MKILACLLLSIFLCSCSKNPPCKVKYDHTWKNWEKATNETWMQRECADCGWIEYKVSHLGYR